MPLAWSMYTQNQKYDLSEDDVRRLLDGPIRALQNQRMRHKVKPTFANVRAWICLETGALTEYAVGEYGVMHLSLQEYLAALYAAQRGKLAAIAPGFGSEWWRAVTLLMVAMREPQTLAPLLKLVLPEYWKTQRYHIEECIRKAPNHDSGPLLVLAGDRTRPTDERDPRCRRILCWRRSA